MNGVRYITDWCWRFLHRPPSAQDIANGQAINAGQTTAQEVLAMLLSCDEYYVLAGSVDSVWVQKVHQDAGDGFPNQTIVQQWLDKLAMHSPGYPGRLLLVEQFLTRHPLPMGNG